MSAGKNFVPRPIGLRGGVVVPLSVEPRDRFGEGEGERRMMGGSEAMFLGDGDFGVDGASTRSDNSFSEELVRGKKLRGVGVVAGDGESGSS